MNIGMLWVFDDFNAPLELNIERAKVYYESKYGVANTAYVHNSELKDETIVCGIRVVPSSSILKRHVWIGSI